MFNKKILINLLFMLSIALITGCYTVIVHQKDLSKPAEEIMADETVYSPSVNLSEPNSCASCHGDVIDYGGMESAHPVFGPTSLWIEYYDTNIPWWISREQKDEMAEYDSTEMGLGDTGERRFYGRRRDALNSNNASSSITTTNEMSTGGGAFIPSFPASIPSGGGMITTTITADSNKAQIVDSSEAKQTSSKAEPQNTKRDYGVRKNVKKK